MPSILIIDSNSAVRGLVRKILHRAGVLCIMGDDAARAVIQARVNKPDGVLLDIGPALEGIEAARLIKAELPEAKVVILTGHDEDAFLSGTGKTGADAFLSKKTLRQALLPTLNGLGGKFFGIREGRERRRHRRVGSGASDGIRAREILDLARNRHVRQSFSGLHRIPLVKSCRLEGAAGTREGTICDLSAGGAYVAVDPVPETGEGFALSFRLPGWDGSLTVDGAVMWRNTPRDHRVPDLPTGCGFRFLGLPAEALQRIHYLVKGYVAE